MADWHDDDPFFTPRHSRSEFITEQLARLVTPDTSDPPEVKARKDREAKERLARHDEMFGVGGLRKSLARLMGYEIGDTEGDADVG